MSSVRLLCVLATLSAPLHAATELALVAGQEALDGAAPDWRSRQLDLEWKGEPGDAAWFGRREVERFGLDDAEWDAGLHHALGARTGVGLELTRGDRGTLLPESSWRVLIDQRIGRGTVVHLGWRAAEYTSDEVRVLDLGVEHYQGDWRGAWTVYRGRVAGLAARGTAHVLALDRYYGEDSRWGLAFATGTEVERVGPAAALITDVTELGLAGRHWFGPRWGAAWRVAWHEQGTLYTRTGIEIGLLVRF